MQIETGDTIVFSYLGDTYEAEVLDTTDSLIEVREIFANGDFSEAFFIERSDVVRVIASAL